MVYFSFPTCMWVGFVISHFISMLSETPSKMQAQKILAAHFWVQTRQCQKQLRPIKWLVVRKISRYVRNFVLCNSVLSFLPYSRFSLNLPPVGLKCFLQWDLITLFWAKKVPLLWGFVARYLSFTLFSRNVLFICLTRSMYHYLYGTLPYLFLFRFKSLSFLL